MAGIYIHIPFCRSKCGYCNFYSVAFLKMKEQFISALLKEIALTSGMLEGQQVETIYFGGGTPSLLDPSDLATVIDVLNKIYTFTEDCEITLEANPDDVSTTNLSEWINIGFNRISLGIQSFNTDDLCYLDRKHSPENGLYALDLIAAAPLVSFSVDLIYAIPGQTTGTFLKNINTCILAGTPHLSCYSLTVEENTPLHRNIVKGKRHAPTDDLFIEHWNILAETTKEAGYLHYETSNFCIHPHFSRHNMNYWKDKPYLGLGPSAHSYDLKSRRWNHKNLTQYLSGISKGNATSGEELLSSDDRLNEYLLTGLRTMWGVSLAGFEDRFGSASLLNLKMVAAPMIDGGYLVIKDNSLKVTEKGMPLTDTLTAALFSTKP